MSDVSASSSRAVPLQRPLSATSVSSAEETAVAPAPIDTIADAAVVDASAALVANTSSSVASSTSAASLSDFYGNIKSPVASAADTAPVAAAAAAAAAADVADDRIREIMKRFSEFHTDLTANPRRRLLREGVVARQATFKLVDRTLFLFSDCLLITDSAAGASLVQKQLLDLRSVVIEDGNKQRRNSFVVLTPQRDFSFICRDADDKAQWMTAIRDAAAAHKLSGDGSTLGAAVKGKVFGLGSDGEGYDGRLLSTTVHSAVRDGKDDILLYLLSEREEDPNALDADGATALQYAIRYRNAFAVSLLIAHGADLTHTDARGNTPLHLAADNADFGTAMILISKGAAVTATNEAGLTPLWLLCTTTTDGALAENDVDSVDKTADDTTDEASPDHSLRDDLHSYHARAVMDMIGMMVDAGADVDCHDGAGESLLVRLCRYGQWEAALALMSKGASLTAIDKDGRSPLHVAAAFAPPTLDGTSALVGAALARTSAMDIPSSPAYNHVNTVKALVSAGAAPNIRDHNGQTALHLTSNVLVATTLIVHGARTDLKNSDGRRSAEHFEDKRNFSRDDGVVTTAAAIKAARDDFAARKDTAADDDALTDEADWIGDEQIESCLLCVLPFTLLSRRHHCRACGLLCCAQCSTKKSATPSSGAVRVCDACFNRLSDLALNERRRRRHARLADAAKLKAENDALRAEAQREQRRIDEANSAHREAKLAALREKAAANRPNKAAAPSLSSAAKSSAGVAASMSRNRDALDARGRQLSELSDKSAAMQDDANVFAAKARAIREKAEKNSKFWPF